MLQTVCVRVCVCLSSTTMAWFWVMHAEYAWSRRLVPCEPVDMWCACNWTGGQSVWLSKTHFWQPKRRLQSTFGSQRVFANRGLDNRHWNQPLFHSKHPFFENPNSKVLGMPINMQKLFGCSFPWSPFNLLEGGKQSPSFGHFALFPAQCTRALAHLWRYKRTLGFARTVSDSKSLYLLRGLASNL